MERLTIIDNNKDVMRTEQQQTLLYVPYSVLYHATKARKSNSSINVQSTIFEIFI